MRLPFLFQALLLGFQHTFEPDHLAAVSVLATGRRSLRSDLLPILWRSSQWALGHGFTLMVLSGAAILFKSSLPVRLSELIEVWVIGPVMIGLGLLALWRAATLYSHVHGPVPAGGPATHPSGVYGSTPHVHAHPPRGEEVHAHVPGERLTLFNRSFGVGMLHGAAGTGGALAVALGLAADSAGAALLILMLESVGVLLAMSGYALLLVFAARRMAARHAAMLRGVNVVIGVVSIAVGVAWLQQGLG